MKTGLLTILRNALHGETDLHPLEQRLARHYLKRRIALVYPELRNDPGALDEAYRLLSIEPATGTDVGDPATYYDIQAPM